MGFSPCTRVPNFFSGPTFFLGTNFFLRPHPQSNSNPTQPIVKLECGSANPACLLYMFCLNKYSRDMGWPGVPDRTLAVKGRKNARKWSFSQKQKTKRERGEKLFFFLRKKIKITIFFYFQAIFRLFAASVWSRPPGPSAVPGVFSLSSAFDPLRGNSRVRNNFPPHYFGIHFFIFF